MDILASSYIRQGLGLPHCFYRRKSLWTEDADAPVRADLPGLENRTACTGAETFKGLFIASDSVRTG